MDNHEATVKTNTKILKLFTVINVYHFTEKTLAEKMALVR